MYTRQWALDRRLKVFQEAVSDRNIHSLRKSWSLEANQLSLFCRRSQYRTEESDDLKYRIVEMRIGDQDRTLAIAFFHEWSLTGGYFPGHEHFIEFADAITQQDYDMAEFVSSCWDDDDHPLYYGNIVLFDRLSIAELNPLIWPLLLNGIDRQFRKNMALLVLKVFPLEFEGRIGDGIGGDTADTPEFDKRQAAMKRLYRRKLGMNYSVADSDKNEWMWRSIRGPQPEFK